MNPLIALLGYKKNNPLACRVLIYVVVFSSCVTLAATAWQLYANFSRDVEYIGKRVAQIEKGYGRSLSLGVWDLDLHNIRTLLGGIIELPDIQFLEVRGTGGQTVAHMGSPREKGVMLREYPLVFTDSRGVHHSLGTLSITASLSNVYRRLRESVFRILVSQSIKTFLVSGFILLVIRHFITRHLSSIALYVSQEKLGYLEGPIRLGRPEKTRGDEMDLVAGAINRMRENLLLYISERDQKEVALSRARDYIDGIINAMPSVLVGVDAEGRVTQWNRGAEALTGISGKEAVGRSVIQLFKGLGGDMIRVLEAVPTPTPLRKNKIPVPGEEPLFYDITLYPLSVDGENGGVIRMDDVTERVRMEEMLIQSEKMHSVGLLAAGVAHEINNPTTGVINLSQILMNDTDRGSPSHDMARRINGEGERIARIVNNLLSFSRTPEGEGEGKEPSCIGGIITETLALTEAQIRKEGTLLNLEIPALPLVSVIPRQIQQVFLNVISNAQYALNQRYPGGHGEKIMEIRCEAIQDQGAAMVRTTITDRGSGMPEQVTKRVFDPFFTTKPAGIGTGLGLSICHGIVENHGGVLRIESREGRYTRATVDLPVSEG